MTLGEAIDAVLAQGGFDSTSSNASRATVASWVDTKQKEMVRKAKFLREPRELGPTVANTATYDVPSDVVEIDGLQVAQTPYIRKGTRELRKLLGGFDRILYSLAVAGFFVPTYTTAGGQQVTLYPTPTVAAQSISADCVVQAATVSVTDETVALVVPDEWCQAVVDGSIAMGRGRVDQRPDLAQVFEASFQQKTEELRRYVVSRVGGSGPTQLRVTG